MSAEHKHDHCCGSHDKPLSEVVLNPEARAGAQATLCVAGMDCADEVEAIQRALKPLAGVREARVNLMAGKVVVVHDRSVTSERLIQAIAGEGLKASPDDAEEKDASAAVHRARFLSVAASGVLTGAGLVLQWTKLGPLALATGMFVVAILTGGWLILPKAVRALQRLSLDMNVLMTVAVIGAVVIGEHAQGAAVVFLFSLSELLESWSVGRARRAIQALMKLTPDVALVKREGGVQKVPANEVSVGETIQVKSGQKEPLDGTVTSGASALDQAPITGESMPVEKQVGDTVFAGTINGGGSLEVQTTKVAGDTTIARIIKMVEESQEKKAPVQRFVDVFAKYYTPAVMILAVLVCIVPPLLFSAPWMDWVYWALVLLVIACPCALVISTPVSVVAGLTALARRGVLVKGGAYLEALGRLQALAVDKTGTITEGKPRVLDVLTFSNATPEEILRIAAAIDTHSTHPLARAVVRHAIDSGITIESAADYQARTGKGAEAKIEGHDYFVGNHRFAHELGVCSDKLETLLAEIEAQAKSVVIVGHRPHAGCTGEVLGILTIGDTIRANAAEALRQIHAAGIRKVVMLSGDNSKTARAIALEAGIDEAFGDLLPEDKIERVKALEKEFGSVGMIGDGVNDAPALAAANVGIAMGAAGTDTAIETADVALMRDDLMMVSEAIRLGRRTLNMIRFNIAFALGIKAIFLVLAVLGLTSLWLAILADTGATLLVIANALRLLRPANK